MLIPPTAEQLAIAPWMRVARAELGVREEQGEQRNSDRVVEYLHSCKGPARMLQRDSTAWCAAFAGWCLQRVGIASTNSLAARSYLLYGDEIPLEELRYGDLLIFWRTVPLPKTVINAPGHVGFFDSWQDTSRKKLMVHGGNQRDRVSIAPEPLRRLLAVHRPNVAELALHDLMRKGA